MAGLDFYLPAMAMFMLQFTYAGVSLGSRAALLAGMSPRVFVVYRQAMATVVIAPITYYLRRHSVSACSLNLRSFYLIFLASLIGITINQNFYFEGLYLASSSISSAMSNLIPAITFVIAVFAGMETVNIRNMRSLAKIAGTVICVSGAVSMTLLRGPKLLNSENLPSKSVTTAGGENWLLGCLFLFGSCCFWSIWLILQVPASASHPDHLSLSAWMCFMSTLQSASFTLILERDREAWKINSLLELFCCLYSGAVGSAVSFFIQAWCISRRGPVFSAMFNPLCTVIVTVLAAMFLHEEIYTGSLIGGIGVIIGLYVVLWGKAEEVVAVTVIEETDHPKQEVSQAEEVKILIDESFETSPCKTNLEEPLLVSKSHSQC